MVSGQGSGTGEGHYPVWHEETGKLGCGQGLLCLPPRQGGKGGGGTQACCQKEILAEEGGGEDGSRKKSLLECLCERICGQERPVFVI